LKGVFKSTIVQMLVGVTRTGTVTQRKALYFIICDISMEIKKELFAAPGVVAALTHGLADDDIDMSALSR